MSKNLSRLGSCTEGSCLGFLCTVSAQDTRFVLVTGVTVWVVLWFVFTGMELTGRLGLLHPDTLLRQLTGIGLSIVGQCGMNGS